MCSSYFCNFMVVCVVRRVNVLHDTIHSFLRGTVSVVDALFPLHCFALNGRRQEFRVNFHFSQDLAPAGKCIVYFFSLDACLIRIHCTNY